MHELEPFPNWLNLYDPAKDEQSPFFGKEYDYNTYSETIYGYYIAPGWDFMGSETLYVKVLFIDYEEGYAIIECLGEWNDTINNDIMHFKRNLLDEMLYLGINKYILIGENVLNFHGSDDSYYEEWFEEVEEGWIAMVNFRDFVAEEMAKYNLDSYLNFGARLDIHNWRTMKPQVFFSRVNQYMAYRLGV